MSVVLFFKYSAQEFTAVRTVQYTVDLSFSSPVAYNIEQSAQGILPPLMDNCKRFMTASASNDLFFKYYSIALFP